jgi:hypothetical protein
MARYIGKDGQVYDDNPMPFIFGLMCVVFLIAGLGVSALFKIKYDGTFCALNFLLSGLAAGVSTILIMRRMNRPKDVGPPKPCRNCGAPIPPSTKECPKCGRRRFF